MTSGLSRRHHYGRRPRWTSSPAPVDSSSRNEMCHATCAPGNRTRRHHHPGTHRRGRIVTDRACAGGWRREGEVLRPFHQQRTGARYGRRSALHSRADSPLHLQGCIFGALLREMGQPMRQVPRWSQYNEHLLRLPVWSCPALLLSRHQLAAGPCGRSQSDRQAGLG